MADSRPPEGLQPDEKLIERLAFDIATARRDHIAAGEGTRYWPKPAARAVLRTLTESGRLLPSGGEVSTQWGWRRRKPDGTWTSVLEAINETEARDAIANPTHAWRDGSQLMLRPVHKWDSGGWLPGEWEVAETVGPVLSDNTKEERS